MSVDLEELARRAKEVEPAWDDLREQRVLESIRRAPPSEPEAPRRRVAWIAAAAIVVFGVSAGGWLWVKGASSSNRVAVVAPRAPSEPPEAERSEMVLADGSTVALDADARVRLALQEPERVVLEQERGRAVYTVAQVPARSFEVHTPAAVVRVRGTVFVVEVDDDATLVEVREGRVEVEARAGDGRRSLLGVGDALSVAATAETVPEPEVGDRSSASAVGGRPSESAVGGRSSASAVGDRPSESAVGGRSSESRPPPPPSADELLARADEARLASDPARAAEALDAFLCHHADDGRAASAAFTLGRVENRRGRHRVAARAFERSRALSPTGPHAEDALAQEALAWSSAGDIERATDAARRYAEVYPSGLHRSRVQRLLSGE